MRIKVSGSFSLTLNEVHEAWSVNQKAAHENANIIFGAVQDDNMKDSVKITVIAAGFKDANKKNIHQKQSFLPKTWKAGREIPDMQEPLPNVVHQQRGSGFVLTNTESNRGSGFVRTNHEPKHVHQFTPAAPPHHPPYPPSLSPHPQPP